MSYVLAYCHIAPDVVLGPVFQSLHQADKDLEIVLLKQLRTLEHKLGYQPRLRRWEKCGLAVIAVKLIHQTGKKRRQRADLLISGQRPSSNGIKPWSDANGRFDSNGE
jgi:hypothetical protein